MEIEKWNRVRPKTEGKRYIRQKWPCLQYVTLFCEKTCVLFSKHGVGGVRGGKEGVIREGEVNGPRGV